MFDIDYAVGFHFVASHLSFNVFGILIVRWLVLTLPFSFYFIQKFIFLFIYLFLVWRIVHWSVQQFICTYFVNEFVLKGYLDIFVNGLDVFPVVADQYVFQQVQSEFCTEEEHVVVLEVGVQLDAAAVLQHDGHEEQRDLLVGVLVGVGLVLRQVFWLEHQPADFVHVVHHHEEEYVGATHVEDADRVDDHFDDLQHHVEQIHQSQLAVAHPQVYQLTP